MVPDTGEEEIDFLQLFSEAFIGEQRMENGMSFTPHVQRI